jgi:hypothetical protein
LKDISLRISSSFIDSKGSGDKIVKRLYTGEVVKLTAKRALISDKVGFMVRIAMFKETEDIYITPSLQHQYIPAPYIPTPSPTQP